MKIFIALFVVSVENLKILKCDAFSKNISFFIIYNQYENRDEKMFKEEESIETLKVLALFCLFNYFKNTVEENISQEFILKDRDEIRNYFLKEIEQNELISRKNRKSLYYPNIF